jgi:hypothetical protein
MQSVSQVTPIKRQAPSHSSRPRCIDYKQDEGHPQLFLAKVQSPTSLCAVVSKRRPTLRGNGAA